jgi:ketosteroid isomerase-like protein
MGPENVEIVRRALAAFEGRDAEALLEWCTDDVELRSAIIGGAEGNVYRGDDGVREWAGEGLDTFEELRLVADEFREVGELVVMLGHIRARGGSSGVVLDSPSGWVVALRDGRIASLHGYLEHEAALEAAEAAAK